MPAYMQTSKIRTGKEIVDNPLPGDVLFDKETKKPYIWADKWLPCPAMRSPITGRLSIIDSFAEPGQNLEFDPMELAMKSGHQET